MKTCNHKDTQPGRHISRKRPSSRYADRKVQNHKETQQADTQPESNTVKKTHSPNNMQQERQTGITTCSKKDTQQERQPARKTPSKKDTQP